MECKRTMIFLRMLTNILRCQQSMQHCFHQGMAESMRFLPNFIQKVFFLFYIQLNNLNMPFKLIKLCLVMLQILMKQRFFSFQVMIQFLIYTNSLSKSFPNIIQAMFRLPYLRNYSSHQTIQHTLKSFSKTITPNLSIICLPNYQITYSHSYCFCNLPRSSKFSEELGLQNQFKNIQKQSRKNEKVKVTVFSAIIWIIVSLIGSYCYFWVYDKEQKDKIKLLFQYLKFKTNVSGLIVLLESLIEFDNEYYHAKPHSDQLIYYILKQIIKSVKKIQIDKKCQKLLLTNLAKNTCNLYGKKVKTIDDMQIKYNKNEEIYRLYFERLLLHPEIYHEANIKDYLAILRFLSSYGQIQSLFIAARFIKEFSIVKEMPSQLKTAYSANVESRIKLEGSLIKRTEDKIKDLERNETILVGGVKEDKKFVFKKTMVEPYLYNCSIHKQWIQYIATVTDTFLNY